MATSAAELLKRVPLFEGLSDREVGMIAESMKERNFPPGREVAKEGQHGVGFFVIADGDASVSVGGQPVGRLGPGDYFGEIALIADSDRTATVTAETDLRCYGMTSWDFRPLVEEHAEIAWKLLQAVARKIRDAERRGD
ncbi:MAG TPA: cyclic nucleotide-binding domain-containing protein [Gaiellaceae bacterium]|nr:cyclic nucleotide-binding domain-containing protein [Gaiellaceae bacterium]